MTKMQDIRRNKLLLVFAAILIVLPIFVHANYVIHMLVMMMFFAYLSSAWNIIGGFAGQFALGNGVYLGIGGYIAACLFKFNGVTPWASIVIAGVIAGLFGMLVSYPCFKLRGTYYALATVAVLYVVKIFMTNTNTVFGYETGGSMGIRLSYIGGFSNMQFVSKVPYYYIMLLLLLIIIALSTHIKNSKTGFYFSAVNTNQEAARALGVNATAYKLKAQFLSSFFTAVGGGFYVMYIMYLDPTRVLGYSTSIQILLYAIVGGVGTIWGPILGGLVMYPLSEALRTVMGTSAAGLSTALYGLLLMLVIYFMPKGVMPWIVDKLKDSRHRREDEKDTKEGNRKCQK
jgi:branched-chain amino acid transport system permease protein